MESSTSNIFIVCEDSANVFDKLNIFPATRYYVKELDIFIDSYCIKLEDIKDSSVTNNLLNTNLTLNMYINVIFNSSMNYLTVYPSIKSMDDVYANADIFRLLAKKLNKDPQFITVEESETKFELINRVNINVSFDTNKVMTNEEKENLMFNSYNGLANTIETTLDENDHLFGGGYSNLEMSIDKILKPKSREDENEI